MTAGDNPERPRRQGLGLITRILERAAANGLLAPAPADVLAHLVLSAMIEAALLIAHATDRRAARVETEQGLLTLMSGMLVGPERSTLTHTGSISLPR